MHTPGPWHYGIAYSGEERPLSYRGPGYYQNAGILSASGETIVGCDEYDIFGPWNEAEREENVRLICAAPDLLAALKDLVARCDGAEGVRADGSNIQTMRAHAAIAKAESK